MHKPTRSIAQVAEKPYRLAGARAMRRRWRRSVERRTLWIGIMLVMPAMLATVAAPAIAPTEPFTSNALPFEPPSLDHPCGTDDLGRDLFSAIIYGARTSLVTGGSVAALALGVGLVIGLTAGFFGAWTGDLLMRLTELFQVIPRFFLAILIVSLFGSRLTTLILVLAFTSWSGLARIVRAETLSLRERDFVLAAHALGAKPGRIMFVHVLPHVVPSLLSTLALIVSSAILSEAGLSYIGLGDPNVVSWGYLINNAQAFLYRAWWLSVFPGAAIVLTTLGFGLVVDGLRSAGET